MSRLFKWYSWNSLSVGCSRVGTWVPTGYKISDTEIKAMCLDRRKESKGISVSKYHLNKAILNCAKYVRHGYNEHLVAYE